MGISEVAWLALMLLAVKLAWLGLDVTPRLYMGDSMSYLKSAALLTGSGSRSFLYGWVLRFTALPFDSPVALVAVQACWSLLSCLGLYILLRCPLGLPRWPSATGALLLATEPAQVFLERMVMAETLGLLALVATLLLLARYLASGRLRWYLLACLGGLAAAAIRLNLLPVVLGLGLAAPLLWAFAGGKRPATSRWRHLAIALAMLVGTHVAYTQAYGRAAHAPAGYLAHTGMMRIGLVAPLIEPEHFHGTGVSGELLREVRIPLNDHWQRSHHIWDDGGLWSVLVEHSTTPELVARTVTRRALLGDPLGLLRINIATLAGYFDARRSRSKMLDDTGVRTLQPPELRQLHQWTGWNFSGSDTVDSPARRYFALSAAWLAACLFALGPLAVITGILGWRSRSRDQYLLLALVSLGLVANHLLFAHIHSYRYLHPMPLFVIANLVVILVSVRRRRPPNLVRPGRAQQPGRPET
ncbi:glycosyltransferase family 39 protein [Luteimonas sp. RD2P54]|uniref:Glycosyltransferase family 39 protein n=1 Tax=Luteimonas endophytica TaxID=3042023 RepID=A0ABT6J7L0_9GAMM|nr:glycosyltransferase family 39 protein [Luteimonas endophytica]MDH5822807.1 glycosyltransferase family 39 protein [Luteimonas endophytica]